MSPLERARLSLLGLSIGDGFGHGFMWEIERLAAGQEPRPPWGWTDDTEMACSVVRVLRDHGAVDQDALAASFAQRFDAGRMYGPAMLHRYFPRVQAGEPWRAVAGSLFDGQGSFGNGGAMRVAPLGAYFADDLGAVVEQARRSAEVTHAHPEGAAGAIAVALAAAWAWRLREAPPRSPRGLIERVLEGVPASEVREGLELARDLDPRTPLEGAGQLLGNGARVSAQDTAPFALWSAGRNLTRFADALWDTIAVQGDMDTTAAIVGGVVALCVGEEGIPPRWLAQREALPAWA
ncbi:MAG: ADP-ribosylglycohydrolase family protein [Planctomycetota bacterium]